MEKNIIARLMVQVKDYNQKIYNIYSKNKFQR